MRSPLGVRVNDGTVDRHVTKHTSGLRFTTTAPGGHHSAAFRVNLPLDTFDDLGPNDKVYVYDGRNGRTVWEGYPENPGGHDGTSGQGFDISAMGGQVLAADTSTPVVFIERQVGGDLWKRVDNTTPGGTDSIVDADVMLQFPASIPVGTNSRVVWQYQGLMRAGQRLHATEAVAAAGKTDAGYSAQIVTRDNGDTFTGEVAATQLFNTAGPILVTAHGSGFPLGRNTCEYRIIRTGSAGTVGDDTTFCKFVGLSVRAVLKNKDGTDASAAANYVIKAHEVVNHLLGALLPMYDGAGATVATTTTLIEQLTYHDGTTPRRVLDDLPLFEPDYLWEVLESNAAGKHRFNYRAWPTTARYEVSTRDGYTAPGGDADLCNRIVVYWTDAEGSRQSTTVTSVVPALGTRVRDATPVTLPAGLGVAADAQRAGEMVLGQKGTPPRAARVTVGRPILDHLKGRMVMPWEIEPGYLVRVRETGENLRLTEMTYSDERVSADLTLGSPLLSMEQIIGRVAAERTVSRLAAAR